MFRPEENLVASAHWDHRSVSLNSWSHNSAVILLSHFLPPLSPPWWSHRHLPSAPASVAAVVVATADSKPPWHNGVTVDPAQCFDWQERRGRRLCSVERDGEEQECLRPVLLWSRLSQQEEMETSMWPLRPPTHAPGWVTDEPGSRRKACPSFDSPWSQPERRCWSLKWTLDHTAKKLSLLLAAVCS